MYIYLYTYHFMVCFMHTHLKKICFPIITNKKTTVEKKKLILIIILYFVL